jgi:hypothetical protein
MPARTQPKVPTAALHVADLPPVLPAATLDSEYKSQLGALPSESVASEINPLVGLDHVRFAVAFTKNANTVLLACVSVIAGAVWTPEDAVVETDPTTSYAAFLYARIIPDSRLPALKVKV